MDTNAWSPQSLNPDKPLYLAIADALEQDIRSGTLKAGEKLPPQRELADRLGINLSTVTRAFRECELRGLLAGTVGRGTYVTSDVNVPVSLTVTEEAGPKLLDMGLVLPLYAIDTQTEDHVRSILQEADLGSLLRYNGPAGLLRHREAGSAWLNRFGLNTAPTDITVTAGSQNALACCLTALFNSGDRIAVDRLTYPGIKTLAAMLGIRLVPIEADGEGMSSSRLSDACKRDAVRGVYLMPEVQNPTTGAISPERREQLAAVIRRNNLILIEDDAYSHTGSLNRKALSTLLPENGIYIGGTSKLLGAGFRISFAAAPKHFRVQMEKALQNIAWMASPINAELVSLLLTSGKADAILRAKRAEAGARTALALERLSAYTVFSRPCGFFIWLLLPRSRSGREFELAAREAGVQVFCAEKFMVGSGSVPSAIRISLTGPETREDLSRGLDLLAALLAGGRHEPGIIF